MVKVNYNGVSRERLLGLGAFRSKVIAIQNHYRPFHESYLALRRITEAIDAAAGLLLCDAEIFHAKVRRSDWRPGDDETPKQSRIRDGS